MKLTRGQIPGRHALFVITIICATAMLAAAQGITPAQNPVDLDKALQEKAAQNRAESYYH